MISVQYFEMSLFTFIHFVNNGNFKYQLDLIKQKINNESNLEMWLLTVLK